LKAIVAVLVLAGIVTSYGQVQPASTNPFSDGARFNYNLIKGIITGAAGAMPAEKYGFRPTSGPDVRTFGQFVGHLADANYRMCSIVAGQNPPMDTGLERSAVTKADLAKALVDSFKYCDKVYDALTDDAGAALVKFDAGGEGTRQGPLQVPKLTALAFHVQHAFEHYGNLVTYMRMENVIPPTSQLRPIHQPAPAVASPSGYKDVSGDWNLVVQTPDGPVKATLSVKLDGNSLIADVDSERGVVKMTGVLTATEFKLSGLLQTLPVTLSGAPGIRTMSGTADFGGHAAGSWSATRPQ
jgi:hypothetical protein